MVTDPMERCLRRLNERMEQALLPQTAREFYDKYTKEPVVPGLQKEIMEIIEDKEHYKFLRGRVNKEVDSARWRCVAAEYAGLWLTTAPTHYMFRVADNHFRAASRIRLGLPPHDNVRFCSCQTSFVAHPQHLLSCTEVKGHSTIRHNMIRDTLLRVATFFHIGSKAEPRCDSASKMRTDAIFYFRAKFVEIDVAVIHPLATGYVGGSCSAELAAAKEMEKRKERKYAEIVQGTGSRFIPVVMEATGGFGPRTNEFIESFVEDVRGAGAQSLIMGSVANFIRKLLAFALCTGNGLMYEAGIRKSRNNFEHY
jgi:hypothetical protein